MQHASGRTRSVVIATGMLAIAITGYAGAASGDPLREGARNGTADTRDADHLERQPSTDAPTGGYTHAAVQPLQQRWRRRLRLPLDDRRLGGHSAAQPVHPLEQPVDRLRVRVQRVQRRRRRPDHRRHGWRHEEAVHDERHGRGHRPQRRPRRRPRRRAARRRRPYQGQPRRRHRRWCRRLQPAHALAAAQRGRRDRGAVGWLHDPRRVRDQRRTSTSAPVRRCQARA